MNSINTNVSALQGVAALNAASQQVTEAQSQISTGLKVASTKDDGAAWSIAQTMRSEISGWQTVGDSLNRGQSILDVAAQGASQIGDLLNQLKAKALSYGDTSLDAASHAALQTDMAALIHQIDQIASNADFDGVNLLDPPIQTTDFTPPAGTVATSFTFSTPMNGSAAWWSFTGATVNTDSYSWQIGYANSDGSSFTSAPQPVADSSLWVGSVYPPGYTSSSYNFTASPPTAIPPPSDYGLSFSSVTFSQTASAIQINSNPNGGKTHIAYQPLTSAALGLASIDWTDPSSVLTAVSNALATATNASTSIGTQSNMLTGLQTQATRMQDKLQTGVSDLVDANMGEESAKLTAAQSKQQLAAKALAIANAAPQWILKLFR